MNTFFHNTLICNLFSFKEKRFELIILFKRVAKLYQDNNASKSNLMEFSGKQRVYKKKKSTKFFFIYLLSHLYLVTRCFLEMHLPITDFCKSCCTFRFRFRFQI